MLSLVELHEEFMDEIGGVDGELDQFVESADITRWLNQGQRRLGWLKQAEEEVTWDVGDSGFAFPDDYYRLSAIIPATGTILPARRLWADGIRFSRPEGATSAGTATILYYARPAQITDSQDSELTDEGDNGIVAYALYRFFKRMASVRSNYERYATLTGANGVTMDDLLAHAERFYDEFVAAEASLPVAEPSHFYGDGA